MSKNQAAAPAKDITETKQVKVVEAPQAPTSQAEPDIEVEAPETTEAQEASQSEIKTTEARETEKAKANEEDAVKTKAASEKIEAPKGYTVFVTKIKECCVEIMANGTTYDAKYDAVKKIGVWFIEDKDVESFSKHMFVQHSKITKALK